jgi:hypothetical protein
MTTKQQNDGPGGGIEVLACGDASALHASAGGLNLVAIGNLRVMIKNDGNQWVAQGLEIDYAVDGTSLSDVKNAFEQGLKFTIGEHLRIFGDFRRLLRLAPADVWDEFYACALNEQFTHQNVSLHQIPMNLDYYEMKDAA